MLYNLLHKNTVFNTNLQVPQGFLGVVWRYLTTKSVPNWDIRLYSRINRRRCFCVRDKHVKTYVYSIPITCREGAIVFLPQQEICLLQISCSLFYNQNIFNYSLKYFPWSSDFVRSSSLSRILKLNKSWTNTSLWTGVGVNFISWNKLLSHIHIFKTLIKGVLSQKHGNSSLPLAYLL